MTPVFAADLRERLWEILDTCLRDQRQAWVLDRNGVWTQLAPEGALEGPGTIGTHQMLMKLALGRDVA